MIRTIVIGVYIWIPPILGNYHFGQGSIMRFYSLGCHTFPGFLHAAPLRSKGFKEFEIPWFYISLPVQVPDNHILPQNLYYNYYYPIPKYLIIGYLDP